MQLEPGQSLLHYRIVEKIGEGGMGVVWRATDTELGRDVAIKMLPGVVADDGERLARFEREARLLASLNHPHIATIHGLHEASIDGQSARLLVMELVEGDDLSQLVTMGVSYERAIEIAIEITRALEAAHANGIVHRDLKPANVKLTVATEVKVLDFGLAKAVGVEPVSSSGTSPAMSPTITSAGTVAGAILGTASYMSPEQARGRAVDRRADMWAFGCLLYELLTGQRAFGGETISDTLAAVLKESPDWSLLPKETPAGVRRLLRRCLEKDARKRWSDAADARLELEEAQVPEPVEETSTPVAAPSRRYLPWLIAVGAIALAIVGWIRVGSTPPDDDALLRLTINMPDSLRIEDEQESNVELSPDGRFVVFSGLDDGGQSALYIRSLDTEGVRKLAGTENGENPIFSPDGNWIAFFADGQLRKMQVSGGPPVAICDLVGSSRGASWGYDDRIIFPKHFDTGLWQVPGSGGTPAPLTELDADKLERTHRWPQIVPGHPIVLFTVATTDSPEFYDDAQIDAVNLETGKRKTVFQNASFARYAASGHLIFGRDGALWAIPFDIDKLETTGSPLPVQSGVQGLRNSGVVFASISNNGMLAYLMGQPEDNDKELLWKYFDGGSVPVPGFPVDSVVGVDLSPDGEKIAVSISGTHAFDIWVFDIEKKTRTRITFDGDCTDPHFTADSQAVIYALVRDGLGMVAMKAADGSGDETILWRVDGVTVGPEDVSLDGSRYLFSYHGSSKSDLYIMSANDPTAEPEPFIAGPGDEDLARFSPDGRWLAYTTDEGGDYEVFVRSASGGGGQWQVSNGPGILPRWAPDGRKLYFRAGRNLYVVDVQPGENATAFGVGAPRQIFNDLDRSRFTSGYGVSLDGKAILVPKSLQDAALQDKITILVNWLDEVERIVPSGR